jgi:hypothetical protein
VNFPKSLEKIGDWGFARCGELVNLTIPDSITKIDFEDHSNFGDCGKAAYADSRDRGKGMAYLLTEKDRSWGKSQTLTALTSGNTHQKRIDIVSGKDGKTYDFFDNAYVQHR